MLDNHFICLGGIESAGQLRPSQQALLVHSGQWAPETQKLALAMEEAAGGPLLHPGNRGLTAQAFAPKCGQEFQFTATCQR